MSVHNCLFSMSHGRLGQSNTTQALIASLWCWWEDCGNPRLTGQVHALTTHMCKQMHQRKRVRKTVCNKIYIYYKTAVNLMYRQKEVMYKYSWVSFNWNSANSEIWTLYTKFVVTHLKPLNSPPKKTQNKTNKQKNNKTTTTKNHENKKMDFTVKSLFHFRSNIRLVETTKMA